MPFYIYEISTNLLISKKEIRQWLQQNENERLNEENIQMPNTDFFLKRTVAIQAKIIFCEKPLQDGPGTLPDWLQKKKKKGLLSLDTYKTATSVFSGVSLSSTDRISYASNTLGWRIS